MKLIPAIDILDGRCVRLTKGDYATAKVYFNNPVDWAKTLQDHGMRYLHVVDLDGAKSSQIVNYRTLEALATQTNLQIDFVGGVKSTADLETAFSAGASQVSVGSIAATNPVLFLEWMERFGADNVWLGADCQDRRIATHGWQSTSSLEIISYLQAYQAKGVQTAIVTDIAKDGMLSGPSLALYREIQANTSLALLASGGIAKMEDLEAVRQVGCAGVIIGKALYEGTITLNQLRELC